MTRVNQTHRRNEHKEPIKEKGDMQFGGRFVQGYCQSRELGD